jgi:quercetin dioxygenase-like cupin family protein
MLVSCQPAEQPSEEPAPEAAPADTDPMDPTVTDPGHYKVELENDQVRVVRSNYAAGEESASLHSHPVGAVVFLTDGSGTMTLEDGSSEERSAKAGDVWFRPAETHSWKSDTDLEVVLVELKGAGGVEVSDINSTVTEPDHNQIELENEKVRILRVNYPGGYKTALHDHLPAVTISLTDVKVKSTAEGEEAQEIESKAGDVRWSDAGPPHVSEILSEEAVSAIRVEIK